MGKCGKKSSGKKGGKSQGKVFEGESAQGYSLPLQQMSMPPYFYPQAPHMHPWQQMQMYQSWLSMQQMQFSGEVWQADASPDGHMTPTWQADASPAGEMSPILSAQGLLAPRYSNTSVEATAASEPLSANQMDTAVTSDAIAAIGEHVNVDPWQRYQRLGDAGKGGSGIVYLARDLGAGERLVAIKRVVWKDTYSDDRNMRELEIMKKLNHPHICKLFATYMCDRHRYFIMEYLEGGELLQEILDEGCLCEEKAREIFRQVAGAMEYAHAIGIAHRDLKPENICFDSKHRQFVKVIDWGHGAFLSGLKRMTTPDVGIGFYQAPEVQEAKAGQTYTCACDLWSLGAVLYVMLTGKMPAWALGTFNDALVAKKAEKISMDGVEWTSISQEAKDLIRYLMKADPELRRPIKEVLKLAWMARQS